MKPRWMLFGGLSFALIAIWYFFIYAPLQSEHTRIRDEIGNMERQIADYNRTIGELPRFLEANQNLELLKGELNSSLFAKSDLLDLFAQISTEATIHNLTLLEITPPVSELLELNRRVAAENEPQFLTITHSFEGDYVSFGKYVAELENKPYFREVKSCVIRGGYTPGPNVNMRISFKALIGTSEETA